jgi:hypothetical protein
VKIKTEQKETTKKESRQGNRNNEMTSPTDKKDEMGTFSYGTHDQVTRFTSAKKDIASHVGTTYKQGKEMWNLLIDNEEAVFPEPVTPSETDKAAMEKYKMLLRGWIDDQKDYRRDKARVFRIIMTQSTAAMKNKIESLPEYKKMEKDDDVSALLAKMKQLVYSTDKAQYEYWTMQATMKKLTNLKQQDKETLTDFYKRFLNQLEVTEAVWGKMTPETMHSKAETAQKDAREKYLACVFLAGVDRERNTTVIDDLNNDFLVGKVTYPSDTSAMLTLLSNRRGNGGTSKQEQALRDGVSEGESFQQARDNDQNEHPDIKCYNCNKKGHYADDCQEPKKKPKPKKKKKKKSEDVFAQEESEDENESEGWSEGH